MHWLWYTSACVRMRAPVSQRSISGVLLDYSLPYFFAAGSLTDLGTLFVCLFVLLLFCFSHLTGQEAAWSVRLKPSAPPLEIKGIKSHSWISCGYKLRPSCLYIEFFNHLSQLSNGSRTNFKSAIQKMDMWAGIQASLLLLLLSQV